MLETKRQQLVENLKELKSSPYKNDTTISLIANLSLAIKSLDSYLKN